MSDLGSLDIAVINDFFPAVRAPMGEATTEEFRKGLEALMVVPFETASAAARHMRPNKCGKMIFVTSGADLMNQLENEAGARWTKTSTA